MWQTKQLNRNIAKVIGLHPLLPVFSVDIQEGPGQTFRTTLPRLFFRKGTAAMTTGKQLRVLALMVVWSLALRGSGQMHPDLAKQPWRAQLYVVDEQLTVNRYNADGSPAQADGPLFCRIGAKGQRAGGIECGGACSTASRPAERSSD